MKVSKRLSKSIISLLLICTIVITPFTSLMTTMANEITQVKETNSSSYDVTFTVESQWDKTYQGNIIIKNKGNLPINNWSLTFDMEHQISNIWNATIGSHSGTTYVINNAGHNKDIAPGQSVVIGYQASFTSKINLPSTYNLSFKQQELELNQENIFHGEGYDVEFHVNNQWDGAFNGEITIVNHTQVSIDNWAIQFNLDHEITNIWNAVVNKHNGNTYIIKNADFNQDIAAEQSVTFGFEAKYKDIVTSPTNFDLLMKEEDVSTSDYTIDFRVTSDWGSAFNGEISITNNTDVSIEDWNLEFDFDHKIERFWTATIISEEDNHYIVKNAGYNANIKPGQTLVLGFGGNPGNVSGKPTNFKLSKIALDNPSNNEIIEDPEVIATDVQKQKAKESLLNWTEPDLPALQAEFNDEFQKAQDLYYKGLQLENQDRYQEAQGAYLDLLIALDNKKKKLDEVNQILEEVRSDPYGDYDQDGLLNGYEISAFYGYMNPMVARSNEDGLSDGEDDFDLDGLSNLEEQGYGTSPVNSDTDDDGINDKRELELGLDPLNPNDSQNLVRQMISLDDTGIRIEITAQGDAEGKVSAAKAEDSFESTYAVTDFYEISTDVKYDSAKINIPVDFSKIEPYNYNKLWIMYYDEDLGGFLPLENTMIDAYNGYVSAVTNQLSTYAVFYVDSWNNYFNVPVNQTTKVTAGTITINTTQTRSLDSDNDGIPDSMEKEGIRVGTSKKLIYTNPYDADSDNDGLLDGEEIDVKNPIETTILWIYRVTWYRMRSNPNLADTDNDKLNDYKEIKTYNTNPLKYDTDGDKLNDYLECTVYKTNPNLMDTDKDSIHDYDECSNSNYDPLVFDTVIKAKRTYIIDKNTTLKGRVHIQAPIVVNEDVSLTLSNIINIYIESIKSKATWESNVFTVYGNLYANDESKKELIYNGTQEWTGIMVQDNGYASLKNCTIAGMLSGIYVSEGSKLYINKSEIKNCYEGISTFYATNKGTVVNITDTNFKFDEEVWAKSYPAVHIVGETTYTHKGGTIDNFATGIILTIANKENTIKDIKIKDGDCGIYISDSTVNISNATLDNNIIGLEAYGYQSNAYLEKSYVWNSDEYGLKMGKQAAVYTYNNAFYGNKTDIKNNFLKETFLSLAMSLIPFGIGDGVDLMSSIYGRDIFTDQALSSFERGLGFLCMGEVKKLDSIIDTSKLAAKLPKGLKYIDQASSLATKYGDDFIAVLNKYDSKKANQVLELYQKYGDSFIEILLKYSDDGVDLLVKNHGREAIDLIGKLGDYGIKAIKYNDNLFSKYSKLDNIEDFAVETESLSKKFGLKSITSNNYLTAMKKSFGWEATKKLGDSVQAHHLFPEKYFGKGKQFENLLKNNGINYCDPRLISWYDKTTHLSNINKYNDDIFQAVRRADDDIKKLIDEVREVARKYGFEPKF